MSGPRRRKCVGPIVSRVTWHGGRGTPYLRRWALIIALDVVVERELVRMRTQPNRIDLILPLVLDPGLDQVRGEHVALEEELVVLLEVVEHDVERAGKLLDLLLLGGRQLVQILVHRLARIDLVRDAVETRHDARGE